MKNKTNMTQRKFIKIKISPQEESAFTFTYYNLKQLIQIIVSLPEGGK
jgi:hypothetical protein